MSKSCQKWLKICQKVVKSCQQSCNFFCRLNMIRYEKVLTWLQRLKILKRWEEEEEEEEEEEGDLLFLDQPVAPGKNNP
jgi:hypothetical protein